MKLEYIVVIPIALVSCGCMSGPYLRSDVFIDSHQINGLFVMPIVTELTIGPGFTRPRDEMSHQLSAHREIIRKVASSELQRRGYSVTGFSKDYHDLSDETPEHQALRESVKAYINPTRGSGDFKQLSAILFAAISDNPEAMQAAIAEKETAEEKQTNRDRYKEYYPNGTDTALFLFIKSRAAKRGMFGSLSYESALTAKLQLVRIDDGEIVLSHEQEFHQSDILDRKSTERAIKQLLAQIPVKL